MLLSGLVKTYEHVYSSNIFNFGLIIFSVWYERNINLNQFLKKYYYFPNQYNQFLIYNFQHFEQKLNIG